MNTSNAVRVSARLELRPVPWAAVEAIAKGGRLPGWADDFPTAGDGVIAGMLHLSGLPEAGPQPPSPWGHYHVAERASGLVVGGAGFIGPPEGGVTEIGYGIVPSRQGNGYATEAVRTLLLIAWEHPGTGTVIASTETGNVASQRVLEKTGFVLEAAGAERRYRISRPASAAPAPE
jgi:[ribosomal protein S5]-alanine N-acetyltransferase